jgi:hypothetical protein
LDEAERELDAATTRTALYAGAKLQRAKAELHRLEAETTESPKRRHRGAGSADG